MLQRYDFLLNDVYLYAKKYNKYLIFNNCETFYAF